MKQAKPQDLNRKNLIDASNLLKGIEHFVFFGTLLGLVREGDIIPHDDDVDFYVPIEQGDALIERLKTTDFSIGLNTDGKPEQPLCTVRAYKFIDGMELDIDFYLYQSNPETDCIIERWNISGKPDNKDTHLHIPKSMIFPLKTQRFFDCDIAMPAKGEDLCEFLYGKDWRTPLRKYTEYIPEITDNNLACAELAPIPNKIYAFWMQGRENAPELVRMNLDRWEQLNPDYELIVLDKETAQPYLADFPIDANKLTVQTFSDILRVTLLARHGGVWTDASVFPTQALSKWLPYYMHRDRFFAYHRGFDTPIPISSWFMAAHPDSQIMQKWYELVRSYWFMEREPMPAPRGYIPDDVYTTMGLVDMRPTTYYPYFWLHHLFYYLLKTDSEFHDIWAKKPRLSTIEPHLLQSLFNTDKPLKKWCRERGLMRKRKRKAIKRYLASAQMQKLDWRRKYPLRLLQRAADD